MDTNTNSCLRSQVERLGATSADIARALGVDPSTISNKLNGRRRWAIEEVKVVLAFLRKRDPSLTYEAILGVAQDAPSTPATSQAA